MKFGKRLGRNIQDIPSEWRPFVIQYKTLKKCIHKIVEELDNKGISHDIRQSILDAAEGRKIEYSFEADPIHIRPYIKIDLDAYERSSDIRLSHPLTEHSLESIRTDFMSSLPSLPSTDSSDTESTTDSYDDITSDTISVYNDSTDTHLDSIDQSHRMMYIELENDGEFFNTLLEEVSQLNHLQQQNKDKYMVKMNEFSEILINITSPYKKDMYTWREIFQLYLQAEIFIGNTEADRNERDWKNAQKQFNWFSKELFKAELPRKFRLNSSKEALHEFLRINGDLISMKRFQYLNKTAMYKILKKHDKRTCLAASTNFGKLLENDPYLIEDMGKSLCCIMDKQLSTIIPQLDDHTCPICTFIYWKPIRLCCGHVFCVRCLITSERKGTRNCPICRSKDAIYKADASNLDKSLQNFIKLYFPREVDAKRKENGRQEVEEEMEILRIRQGCDIM